jgi:hypothetical protein
VFLFLKEFLAWMNKKFDLNKMSTNEFFQFDSAKQGRVIGGAPKSDDSNPKETAFYEEKWEKDIKGKAGIAMICPKCGGSSAAFCGCAKQKWIQKQKNCN